MVKEVISSRQWVSPYRVKVVPDNLVQAEVVQVETLKNIVAYYRHSLEVVSSFDTIDEAVEYLLTHQLITNKLRSRVRSSIKLNLSKESQSAYGFIFTYKVEAKPTTKEAKEEEVNRWIQGLRNKNSTTPTPAPIGREVQAPKGYTAKDFIEKYDVVSIGKRELAQIAAKLVKSRGLTKGTTTRVSSHYGEYVVNIYPKYLLDEIVQEGYTLTITKGNI